MICFYISRAVNYKVPNNINKRPQDMNFKACGTNTKVQDSNVFVLHFGTSYSGYFRAAARVEFKLGQRWLQVRVERK